MKNFLISLAIFFSLETAIGNEYKELLNIIDTSKNEHSILYLKTTNGLLDKIKLVTTKKTLVFSYDEVLSEVTLVKEMGITVMTLKGTKMSKVSGGQLKLKYLKNFNLLGSEYRKIDLIISKIDEEWTISYENSPVSLLLVTPHAYGVESYQFK